MSDWKLVAESKSPGEPRWFVFGEPRPYVTVSGFVFDRQGRFVAIHRSAGVRSAPNCWAVPSGLAEAGVPLTTQLAVELDEELNLKVEPAAATLIGVYENRRPDDRLIPPEARPTAAGWHWVILVYVLKIDSFDGLVNNEPHKHDAVEIIDPSEDASWTGFAWEPALGTFIREHKSVIDHFSKTAKAKV